MVLLMVEHGMTAEGRVQAQRVLNAANQIIRQSVPVQMPFTELVRYCAHELDVSPDLPLRLLDEQLDVKDEWDEPSGVFMWTEFGIVPVRAYGHARR